MITVKNYGAESKNIDWSKLPKDLRDIKGDIDFSIEFYDDDEGIKETVDLFLKAVNKVSMLTDTQPKKQAVIESRVSTRSLIAKLPHVKILMPKHQQKALISQNSDELDDVLLRLEKELSAIPKKAQGESIMDSKVYAHYFYAGSDWFVLDYDKANGELFGFVVLNGDTQMSEAGYSSVDEIVNHGKIELDFYFTPGTLKELLIKKYPGEYAKLEEKPATKLKKTGKSSRQKKPSKAVGKKVDAKIIDNFSNEFRLIRRFYNMVSKKEVVSFRSVQLLHMAFQKAVVSRDVRKKSEDADLFTRANKKVVALFKIADKEKSSVDIEFTDRELLNEMEAYSKSQKINPAITLLRSFIGMQGYKPEIKKAENLLKRINSAIDKDRIDKNNRLYAQLIDAKKELTDYIKKPSDKIKAEIYALSYPKRSVCTNRIKCTGLRSDGKLRKGYKFNTHGNVIKTSSKKKRAIGKQPNVKKLGTVLIDVSPEPTHSVTNNQMVMEVPMVIESYPSNTHQEHPEEPERERRPKTKRPSNKYIQNVSETKLIANNANYFNLKGAFIEFTGPLEQKTEDSLVITLDAPPGAGKTRSVFQFLNLAANSGIPSIFASLEEHPSSKIFHAKRELYITPHNEDYIDTIGELPPTYDEFLKLIEQYQIIAIDSWNKVFETYKGIDFDRDLRKALNGKIIIVIFQRTGTGQMRGGSKAGFDGDIILEIVKADDYRDSYVIARKNRYQDTPLNEIGYNFYHQRVINPELQASTNSIPTEITV